MNVGPSGGIKNEINVTPLVDVVLVLLIIFMVVTPMLQRGKDVQLPKAQTTDVEKQSADPLIISITPDKTVYVESNPYDEVNLERKLGEVLKGSPGRKLLLKADESLSYGDVRRVIRVARKAGAKGISFGVEELKK